MVARIRAGKLSGCAEVACMSGTEAQSDDRFGPTIHGAGAWFLEQHAIAVLREAVAALGILARVAGARFTLNLTQRDRSACPFQKQNPWLRVEERGRNRRVQSGAANRQGTVGESVRVLGSDNCRALTQLIGALGIEPDRAGFGVRIGATLSARGGPELLLDHDCVWRRHRAFIREREAIKACQFDVHLLELRVATDQLLDSRASLGAVETGIEDGCRCCRIDAGTDASGEQGGDYFHGGGTQIVANGRMAVGPLDPSNSLVCARKREVRIGKKTGISRF